MGTVLRLIGLKLGIRGFVLIWAALVLAPVLGELTVRIISGFGGYIDFLHSLKMGYPIFWLSLLMGIGAWVERKRRDFLAMQEREEEAN